MIPFPSFAPHAKSYRFVVRISGLGLAPVDKSLRLRCTLCAADHSVVGISAIAVHLGTASDCTQLVELVHEPLADDVPPPAYYEISASLAPTSEPSKRLGDEYRLSGIVDPQRTRIVLPEIAVRTR